MQNPLWASGLFFIFIFRRYIALKRKHSPFYRPFRPARGINPAFEEIEKSKDILYDEKAVEMCLRLDREKSFKLE